MSPGRRNAAGYSLLEVLVATAILSVALGVLYGSLVAQMRRHVGQTLLAETMHAERAAFDAVAQQIGMAGYGVPIADTPRRPAMLLETGPTRLRFWTNPQATRAFLTSAAKLGDRNLTVTASAGFRPGHTVFVTDGSRWASAALAGAKGDQISLGQALPYNFAAGALVVPIEEVTLEFAKGALWRNGVRAISNVDDLRFTYDAATPAAVRVVSITMSMRTRVPEPGTRDRVTVLATTRIAPPSLAL
jgi:prepilin-type N-terminal cleavage/methylation domain-containing protein